MTLASCTTWECINSFANWLAALGTILITGLALWLPVKDRMVNVKAELSLGLVPGENPNVLDKQVYALSFTNVGPRPVTVTNHCWFLPLTKGVVFLMPQMDPQLGRLCSTLPIELTDGKEGHAFYAHDFFSKLDEPEKFLFHKNRFVAWLRIRFFRIRIATTIGKRLKVRINRTVRRRLWQTYRNA
jgi:hypothetical protein